MGKNWQTQNRRGEKDHHLHRCNKFLRFLLNFWELFDAVAYTGIVTKVNLGDHDDDVGDEEDDGGSI